MSGLTTGAILFQETISADQKTGTETTVGETGYVVVANEFLLSSPITLYAFHGFGNTGTSTGIYSAPRAYLWSNQTLIFAQTIPFSTSSLGVILPVPLTLPAGSYAVGFMLPPSPPTTGFAYAKPLASSSSLFAWNDIDGFTMDSPPGLMPIKGRLGVQSVAGALADVDVIYPNVYGPWLGKMNLVYTHNYTRDAITQPPPPVCTAGAQRFVINNPWSTIPNITEWEIQASSSLNGAVWSDWYTVIVNPGTVTSYPHSNLNLAYLYRYRVRIRTQLQESDWTEPTFVGKPSLTG